MRAPPAPMRLNIIRRNWHCTPMTRFRARAETLCRLKKELFLAEQVEMHDLGRRPRHDDFLRLAPLVVQRLERSARRLLGFSNEVRKGGSHMLAGRVVGSARLAELKPELG